MREPLPLACDTSAAYAQAAATGGDGPRPPPRRRGRARSSSPKEDRQPEHLLVFGGEIPLAALLDQTPRADEAWADDEPTRFGRYARRLWDGLLAREVVSDR